MKKIILAFAVLLLGANILSSAQSGSWAAQGYGGKCLSGDITLQSNGDILSVGTYQDDMILQSAQLHTAGRGVYLSRVSPAGTSNLLKHLARASASVNPVSVVEDLGGNIYVTGVFNDSLLFDQAAITSHGAWDIFVAAFSSAGAFKWVRQIGGTGNDDSYISGATTIPGNNGVVINAAVSGPFSIGNQQAQANGQDIITARFDENGLLSWYRVAGGSGPDEGFAVTADAHGYLYLTGGISDNADFGGLTVPGNGHRPFIAKYTVNGDPVWVKDAPAANGGAFGMRIGVDGDGNIYATGFPNLGLSIGTTAIPQSRYYIAKWDSSGAPAWARYGKCGYFGNAAFAVGANGNVHMGGFFEEALSLGDSTLLAAPNPGAKKAYILTLSNSGSLVGTKMIDEGPHTSYITGLATDPAGNIFTAGYFYNQIVLGNSTFTSTPTANTSNIFVAQVGNGLQVGGPRSSGTARFAVVPNPSSGRFQVLLPAGRKFNQLIVTDQLGRVVDRQQIDPSRGTVPVSLDHVPSGVYTLQVDNAGHCRILIQR